MWLALFAKLTVERESETVLREGRRRDADLLLPQSQAPVRYHIPVQPEQSHRISQIGQVEINVFQKVEIRLALVALNSGVLSAIHNVVGVLQAAEPIHREGETSVAFGAEKNCFRLHMLSTVLNWVGQGRALPLRGEESSLTDKTILVEIVADTLGNWRCDFNTESVESGHEKSIRAAQAGVVERVEQVAVSQLGSQALPRDCVEVVKVLCVTDLAN